MLSFNVLIKYFLLLSQGFETRGTEIGNRQVTWDNLIKALEKGTELIDDVTKIPINFLPKHYGDIDLRKNDIVIQFVSNSNSFTLDNKNVLVFYLILQICLLFSLPRASYTINL